MFDLRLIRAELLKLRRRRGMLAICTGLTLGAVVIYYGVLAVLHLADPSGRGPAGGLENFESAMGVLAMAGGVVGVVVGATAGYGVVTGLAFTNVAAGGVGLAWTGQSGAAGYRVQRSPDGTVTSTSSSSLRPISARPSGEL